MRTEKEMLELILGVADTDERIRAVYMNGSRVNPNVEKGKYQDYDIVFVVTETASFLADKSWIDVFGEISIVQEPSSNDLGWGIEHDFSKSYAWLILFKDGTRIDLHIETETAVSSGMWGRYFEKYLPHELYTMYAKTYSNGEYNNLWSAIDTACDMFRIIAPAVGDHFGYIYHKHEDENTTDYMNKLKSGML